jgi:hypothetical protein
MQIGFAGPAGVFRSTTVLARPEPPSIIGQVWMVLIKYLGFTVHLGHPGQKELIIVRERTECKARGQSRGLEKFGDDTLLDSYIIDSKPTILPGG